MLNLPYDQECIICTHEIYIEQPYAMIDNQNEKGKYHVECLEQWVSKNNNGILTQDKIISYSIYQKNGVITTINIMDIAKQQIKPQNYIQNQPQNYIQNQPYLNNHPIYAQTHNRVYVPTYGQIYIQPQNQLYIPMNQTYNIPHQRNNQTYNMPYQNNNQINVNQRNINQRNNANDNSVDLEYCCTII